MRAGPRVLFLNGAQAIPLQTPFCHCSILEWPFNRIRYIFVLSAFGDHESVTGRCSSCVVLFPLTSPARGQTAGMPRVVPFLPLWCCGGWNCFIKTIPPPCGGVVSNQTIPPHRPPPRRARPSLGRALKGEQTRRIPALAGRGWVYSAANTYYRRWEYFPLCRIASRNSVTQNCATSQRATQYSIKVQIN